MCVDRRWRGRGRGDRTKTGKAWREREAGGREREMGVFFFSFLDSATKAVRANNERGEWCVSGGGTEPC